MVMPSTKKQPLKDLHLASSMSELVALADPNIESNKNANPNLFCKSADKVFLKASEFDLENDEENAFVFYMRYFKIISLIKATTKYKQDKAHFDKLIGATKPIKAIDRSEKLQTSLTKRYENAKEEKEARLLLERKEKERAEASEAAKASQNKSGDNNLDDLLNGPELNSPSELYQKLQVNPSSVLQPQGIGSTDVRVTNHSETVPFLKAEDLYFIIKKEESGRNLLILDIRTQAEYAKNHIFHPSCINIPEEMLQHGVSLSNIDRRLTEKTRLMWRERGDKRHIVIVDKSTEVSQVTPDSLIQMVKNAIYKYDSNCFLQSEPLILDGGFDSWLWHYPSLATRSELPKVDSGSVPSLDSGVISNLSSLDYPELPEDEPHPAQPSTPVIKQGDPSPYGSGKEPYQNGLYPTVNAGVVEPDQTDKQAGNGLITPGLSINKPSSQVIRHQTPGPSFTASNQGPGKGESQVVDGSVGSPTTMDRKTVGYDTNLVNETKGPQNSNVNRDKKDIVYAKLDFPGKPESQPGMDKRKLGDEKLDHPLPTTKQNNSSNYAELVFPGKPGGPPVSQVQGLAPGNGTRNMTKENTGKETSKTQQPEQPRVPKSSGLITTAGLPHGWEKAVDQTTGRIFYRDHNTQTTHWNPPQTTQTPTLQPTRLLTPAQPSNITQAQTSHKTTEINGSISTVGRPDGAVARPQPHRSAEPSIPTPHTMQQGQPPAIQIKQQPQPPAVEPPPEPKPKAKPATPDRLMQPTKSNLRRSLSSPNLAKLEDVPLRPEINRSAKPVEPSPVPAKPSFTRSTKPVTLKLDSLNPIHGGLGCGLTGLRNLGNTCYMNSVLQCLFNTAPLAAYFVSGAFRDDINKENPLGTSGELAEQFSILVRATNCGRFKSLSPLEFKRLIGRIKTSFAGYDQQDSQEFLALMMDKLHEDVCQIRHKPYLKAPDDNIDPAEAANITWDNHRKRNESLMLNLFDGMFKSTVRCLVCAKDSVTYETFSNLTLPLPGNSNHCSLRDCIKLFTRAERMSGDDMWYCPRCKQHRVASKQLQIWRLPPILIVHLKRFQYDGMWRQKLQTAVSFPVDGLDMSGYITGPTKRPAYHLYGVSNHYGTMHGGHYTAFCKNAHNQRWFKFDDQVVTEMSANDIVSSAAYLLFYTSFEFTPPKLI